MSQSLNYFGNKRKIQPINVEEYLKRIGADFQQPSLAYLKSLHRNHLFNIPFENLDIHYRKPIVLNFQKIFDKIISHGRGGICYELNGLFLHLLVNLGFDAIPGSAQVFQRGELSPLFEHMVILVRLNDVTYLCDVGFGQNFIYPKVLEDKLSQLDYTVYFRAIQSEENWILQQSKDNHIFENIYQFSVAPRELIEFLARCNYHQESMDSKFKQQKIITQLFPEGRIKLTDRKLKKQLLGENEEKPILNEDEFLYHLQELFGINSASLFHQQFD